MAEEKKRRSFWRTARVYFRRFRISVLLLLLLLVGLLVYLNQIGLPGMLKGPLLERLRANGIEFEYTRLRLRFYQGIVAEGARFGKSDDPDTPRLTAEQVELHLNREALSQGQLHVDGLAIRNGKLSWNIPRADTNLPPQELSVTNLDTRVRLLAENQWQLEQLTAMFAGARFQLSGIITNGAAVRDWGIWKGAGPAAPGSGRDRLRRWANLLSDIQFSSPPEVRVDLRGDGTDLNSFTVRILLVTPGATTPWADVTEGRLFARVDPAQGTQRSRARILIQAVAAHTPWASCTNFVFDMALQYGTPQSNAVTGRVTCSAEQAYTRWAEARTMRLSADWVHSLTNPIPQNGRLQFECSRLKTEWGKTEAARFEGNFQLLAEPRAADPTLAWWTNLQPYSLEWTAHATHVESETNRAGQLTCVGSWAAPVLTISNLHSVFYGRELNAEGELDITTRLFKAQVETTVDPHRLGPLLPPAAVRWLSQFTWTNPPVASAQASLRFPPWPRRGVDWKKEVLPTLELFGQFEMANGGTYRGLVASSAKGHFSYSNQVWHLPDLRLASGDRGVELEHRADERSRDYYWHIHSGLDPNIVLPLLGPEVKKVFDLISLTTPPTLEAELWGNYEDAARTGVRGHITLTNFSFRDGHSDRLEAGFAFSNQVLHVFEPRVDRGTQHVSASGVMADIGQQMIHITNGFSDMDPLFVARAIGPHIVKIISPYQFLNPPSAFVSGSIPLHGEEGADLTVKVDGGPFQWWKFNLPRLRGTIHWLNSELTLQDLVADFYGGIAVGSAHFSFRDDGQADFEFSSFVTNALLHPLVADLTSATNQLDGLLTGHVRITRADTGTIQSANGYGDLHLKDGLIWDIPLFGVFTPILNGISPGLGTLRANAGDCSFYMTNGVLRFDDLVIRTAAARLAYRGTVDLEGNLDARVEAGLLRDMWVVGPLVSTVLWPVSKMFEYKVTGTLGEPKTEPVYIIPKLIQLPLLPFRFLKGIFQEKTPSAPPSPAIERP
jgi:hypothetical protein